MRWVCTVYEAVNTPRRYVVEADTYAAAVEKAQFGETLAEEDTGASEVADRFVTECTPEE